VNYLNLKDPEFAAAEVEIRETQATYVVNPSAYAEFVTRDLPGQMTFLSMFAIGQSHFIEGAYAESLEAIEKGIDSLPSEAEAPQGLSEAYFRLGWLQEVGMDDDDQAIGYYDRAIELNPKDAMAFNNRGNIYFHSGDYARAIVDYTQAIELSPEDATAFYNRGIAFYRQGDYARAVTDYDRAIQLNPAYDAAFNNRGLAYARSGDYARAIADFDQAIELNPEDATAFCNRGNAYFDSGDYDAAIADYTRVIEIDRYYANAYWGRGLAHRGVGNAGAALADFRRYLELRPDAENREMFEEWIAELEAQVSDP
jgi:tetratricopeptide (TPR) repeat protein